MKTRSILDEPNEGKRGPQRKLSALKEVGVTTTVKRSIAAGHRVIQTRRADRERGWQREVSTGSERLQA